jgi:hypothetical protein
MRVGQLPYTKLVEELEMTENTMTFGKRNTWEIDEKAGTIKIIAEGCAFCGKMTPMADLTACHAACETRYCDHCYEAKYAGTTGSVR